MGKRRKPKPQKKPEMPARKVADLAAEWLPEVEDRETSEILDEFTYTSGAESIAFRLRRSRLENVRRIGRRCVLGIGAIAAGWVGHGFFVLPEVPQTTNSTQCELTQEPGSTRGG